MKRIATSFIMGAIALTFTACTEPAPGVGSSQEALTNKELETCYQTAGFPVPPTETVKQQAEAFSSVAQEGCPQFFYPDKVELTGCMKFKSEVQQANDHLLCCIGVQCCWDHSGGQTCGRSLDCQETPNTYDSCEVFGWWKGWL